MQSSPTKYYYFFTNSQISVRKITTITYLILDLMDSLDLIQLIVNENI